MAAHRSGHLLPPAAGHPGVADLGTAEHAHPHGLLSGGDQAQTLGERRTPDLLELRPVVLPASTDARQPCGCGLVGDGGRAERGAQLVPLDLEGDQGGDEVVDVGLRRDQHGERPLAVVVPPPAPPGCGRLGPVDELEVIAGKDLQGLAHDHPLRPHHRGRQPPHRVEEGAEVGIGGGRQAVQARPHGPMRGLEHPQRGLTGGPEKRRVGAVVHLDSLSHRRLTTGGSGLGRVVRAGRGTLWGAEWHRLILAHLDRGLGSEAVGQSLSLGPWDALP